MPIYNICAHNLIVLLKLESLATNPDFDSVLPISDPKIVVCPNMEW